MTIDEFILEIKEPLDKILNEEDREAIRKSTGLFHHGLGRWIRNNWGLWEGRNPLTDFFHGYGIWHADDMSGIILDSYARTLNGQDVKFEEQVKFYLAYWEQHHVDSKEELRKIIEAEQQKKSEG
jgi:hypothetical protein